MKIDGWVDILKNTKTHYGVLATILLIFGSKWEITKNPTLEYLIFIFLAGVGIASFRYIKKDSSKFPTAIRSIWSKSDLPLQETKRDAWLGKWNCRWSYRAKDNQLKPYVNDILEIKKIDCESGELTGIGHSSYIEGGSYFFRGRVSNKDAAHLFYTSPKETAGLSGMVILSRPPMGEITGWWIGAGRKGGDIGGGVIMERHENNTEFEIKNYDIS